MTILMCRPEFFGIEYEINPWMHVENRVDRTRAMDQWNALYAAYIEMGETVDLVEPVRGLPDMVFTANAAVVWHNQAVLTRFHHPQRQGEEPHFQHYFESRAMPVSVIDRGLSMEGAGDFLFVGEQLFAGFGFRTDRATHPLVSRLLDVEVVSLELVDDRYYHLDTCFAPLDSTTALVNPRAFTAASLAEIHRYVPRVVEVPEDVAAGFACNAMVIGSTVLSSRTIEAMAKPLAALGFAVRGFEMSEFMKSGGGVRCLTLPLDLGSVSAGR